MIARQEQRNISRLAQGAVSRAVLFICLALALTPFSAPANFVRGHAPSAHPFDAASRITAIDVSSDSDFWPLARSDGLGRCVDPGVTATLRPVSSASPLYGAAAPVPGVWTDLDGSTALYWYVTGPNGTVYAVLDGAGNVVNRYEYDSFGVIDWRHSFEGVPNRYTFQGRELDAERGDYYYRARIYDPDHGTFLGPDMNLAAGPFGEPNGMMSYVFCGNDPWTETDPSGLGRPWNTVPNEVSFDSNTGGMDALYGKFDPNWGYGHSYDYSGDLSDLVRVTLSPLRPLQGIGEHFINLPHRFNQYKECYDSTYAAWNALLNPLMWVALDLCEVGYGIGLHPENYVNDLSVEDRFISGLYAVGDAVDAALTIVPVAKGLSVAGRTGVIMAQGASFREARAVLAVGDVLKHGRIKPFPFDGQILFPSPLVLEGRVVRVQNWLADAPLSSVSFYNKGLIGEYSAGYWLGPDYIYHPGPIWINGQMRYPDFVRYYPGTKQIAEIVEVKCFLSS